MSANRLGLTCPACGDTARIDIEATAWVRVTAEGVDRAQADPDWGYTWDDDSDAMCGACGHVGTVGTFTAAGKADAAA